MATKRQHYVPQFVLRHFATDPKKQRVWVLDKRTGAVRSQSIRDSAHENYFYEHSELTQHAISLEAELAAMESLVSPTIAAVTQQHSLSSLGEIERRGIVEFALVQLFRTKSAREYAKLGSEVILGERFSEADAKKASLAILLRDLDRHLDCCDAHILTLREAHGAERFILGDSVVSILGPHGPELTSLTNILPLAILTIPVNRDLCIMLFPASNEPALRKAGHWYRSKVRILDEAQPTVPGDVDNINAASALTANRFLFSETDDFVDVQRVIRENPRSMLGPVSESTGIKWP